MSHTTCYSMAARAAATIRASRPRLFALQNNARRSTSPACCRRRSTETVRTGSRADNWVPEGGGVSSGKQIQAKGEQEEERSTDDERAPRNPLGVQLLTRKLHRQIFPPSGDPPPPVHPDALSVSQSHLSAHGLEASQASVLSPLAFDLPPLQGKDLSEHFWNIGRDAAQPWLGIAHELAAAALPEAPEGLMEPGTETLHQEGDDWLTPQDWLAIENEQVRAELRLNPPKWVRQPGWTRYPLLKSRDGKSSALGPGEAVEYPSPNDGALVFDIENLVKSGPWAVMATAAGPNAWYSWLSPWLLGEGENYERKEHLVPFGPSTTGERGRGASRLVVGHNVSYDRARIREEYTLERGGMRFLDTMALHVATRGISSPQRPAWLRHTKNRQEALARQKHQKSEYEQRSREGIAELLGLDMTPAELQTIELPEDIGAGSQLDDSAAGKAEETLAREAASNAASSLWLDATSNNSLADVAELHCGIHLSKASRNVFVEAEGREEILERLDELLSYCAKDVSVTHAVFAKVWPTFLEHCPHPATTAGVLGLGSTILPVDDEWIEYQQRCQAKYEESHSQIAASLKELAENLRTGYTRDVSWDQANEAAHAKAAVANWPVDADFKQGRALLEAEKKRKPMPWESDPWASQLDWTPKKPKRLKPGAGTTYSTASSSAQAVTPGHRLVPKWYKTSVLSARKGVGRTSAIAPLISQLCIGDGHIIPNEDGEWVLRGPEDDYELDSNPLRTAFIKERAWEMKSLAGKSGDDLLEALQASKIVDAQVREHLRRIADALVQKWSESKASQTQGTAPEGAHPALLLLDWKAVEVPTEEAIESAETAIVPSESWWPKWYWDLFQASTGEVDVTIKSATAPLLLRLSWSGCPLFRSREHGWLFRHDIESQPDYKTQRAPVFFFQNNVDVNLRYDANMRKGRSYYKLPHPSGEDSNVGSPFTKHFLPLFENGTLKSELTEEAGRDTAKAGLAMQAQCSYWIGVRDRVSKQMVVWDSEGKTRMGFERGASGAREGVPRGAKPLTDAEMRAVSEDSKRRKGIILPSVVSMGTVTRRAIERTWLTASNAKPSRVGSELKAMVKAPPGWSIVGADVDSEELWICSVMGDAQFGIHGATAIGWMTLEGTKALGTDLHSKTASILGTSRNQAKVFNYSRIYGAGIKHATQLMLKADPSMTKATAESLARDLYTKTKGTNTNKNDLFGRRFWYGGSESFVFNKLEEVALSEDPRTPALDCGITAALSKQYLNKTKDRSGKAQEEFMPSRINWVVQSSGVDYLHLLLVSMEYLCSAYDIPARFMLSVHDEVRYLCPDEDTHRCAMALQVANLWTRAMFAHKLQMDDLPQGVAFFAAVDVDKILRKEADDPCVTPSHPHAIPPGFALDIEQALADTNGGSLHRDGRSNLRVPASNGSVAQASRSLDDETTGDPRGVLSHDQPLYPPYARSKQTHRCEGERGKLYLQAQAAEDLAEVRLLERRAKEAERAINRSLLASGDNVRAGKPAASVLMTSSARPTTSATASQPGLPPAAGLHSSARSRMSSVESSASASLLPSALLEIAQAFPRRQVRARKPFFQLPAHRAAMCWALYRPLLQAAPKDLPVLHTWVRHAFRKSKSITSPMQTLAQIELAETLLSMCEMAREGRGESRVELEVFCHSLRMQQDLDKSGRAFGRYLVEKKPPAIPRHSGALLPPTFANPPLPRFKPVQPPGITMMIFRRRKARFKRMAARADLDVLWESVELECAMMKELGEGRARSSGWDDVESWSELVGHTLSHEIPEDEISETDTPFEPSTGPPFEERVQTWKAAYEREKARSQMVFPRYILVRAKRARLAKQRSRLRRKIILEKKRDSKDEEASVLKGADKVT